MGGHFLNSIIQLEENDGKLLNKRKQEEINLIIAKKRNR